MLFSENCKKIYKKQLKFSNASRNHKFYVVKINLSVMLALVLYSQKLIHKWAGLLDFWEDKWQNRA